MRNEKRQRTYSWGQRAVSILLILAFSLLEFSGSSPALYAQTPKEPAGTNDPHSLPAALTAGLVLPEELGRHYSFTQAGDGKRLIWLVRDAHDIPEAQKAIRGIMNFLYDHGGVRLALLEGTAGQLDPVLLDTFPDEKAVNNLMEDLLQKGEIAGAAAASVLTAGDRVFHGMENPELYQSAVSAFLETMRQREAFEGKLTRLRRVLEKEKEKHYPEPLRTLNRKRKEWDKNAEAMTHYLSALLSEIKTPGEYPLVHLLLSASGGDSHSSILLSEALTLYEQLREAIDEPDVVRRLAGMKQDLDTERASVASFADGILAIAADAGFSLQAGETLKRAVVREKDLRKLQSEEFFLEVRSLEETVFQKLLNSGTLRELDRRGRLQELAEKMITLELTWTEWQELTRSARHPSFGGLEIERVLKGFLDGENAAARFYRLALERDKSFIEKTIKIMKEKDADSAVLVAGGFHTENLKEFFLEEGYSVAVLVPSLSGLPEEDLYREHMKGNVSWRGSFRPRVGKIHVFDAFHRAAVAKLLRGRPQAVSLWRDNLIRRLAAEGRLEEAGRFTRFLEEWSLERQDPVRIEQVERAWQDRVDRFLSELRTLKKENRLSPEQVGLLTARPVAAGWNAVQWLDPGASGPAAWLRESGSQKAEPEPAVVTEREPAPLRSEMRDASFRRLFKMAPVVFVASLALHAFVNPSVTLVNAVILAVVLTTGYLFTGGSTLLVMEMDEEKARRKKEAESRTVFEDVPELETSPRVMSLDVARPDRLWEAQVSVPLRLMEKNRVGLADAVRRTIQLVEIAPAKIEKIQIGTETVFLTQRKGEQTLDQILEAARRYNFGPIDTDFKKASVVLTVVYQRLAVSRSELRTELPARFQERDLDFYFFRQAEPYEGASAAVGAELPQVLNEQEAEELFASWEFFNHYEEDEGVLRWDPDENNVLIAMYQGRPVGGYTFIAHSVAPTVEGNGIFINEALRGRGLGSLIRNRLYRTLAALGYEQFRIGLASPEGSNGILRTEEAQAFQRQLLDGAQAESAEVLRRYDDGTLESVLVNLPRFETLSRSELRTLEMPEGLLEQWLQDGKGEWVLPATPGVPEFRITYQNLGRIGRIQIDHQELEIYRNGTRIGYLYFHGPDSVDSFLVRPTSYFEQPAIPMSPFHIDPLYASRFEGIDTTLIGVLVRLAAEAGLSSVRVIPVPDSGRFSEAGFSYRPTTQDSFFPVKFSYGRILSETFPPLGIRERSELRVPEIFSGLRHIEMKRTTPDLFDLTDDDIWNRSYPGISPTQEGFGQFYLMNDFRKFLEYVRQTPGLRNTLSFSPELEGSRVAIVGPGSAGGEVSAIFGFEGFASSPQSELTLIDTLPSDFAAMDGKLAEILQTRMREKRETGVRILGYHMNAADPEPELFGSQDILFVSDVVDDTFFTPEEKRRVAENLLAYLKPGGLLISAGYAFPLLLEGIVSESRFERIDIPGGYRPENRKDGEVVFYRRRSELRIKEPAAVLIGKNFRRETTILDLKTGELIPAVIRDAAEEEGETLISIWRDKGHPGGFLILETGEGDHRRLEGTLRWTQEVWRGQTRLYVMNLDTEEGNRETAGEKRRMKYVGTRLIQAAAELAGQLPSARGAMFLKALDNNEHAQRFYSSFRPLGLKRHEAGDAVYWHLDENESTAFFEGIEELLQEKEGHRVSDEGMAAEGAVYQEINFRNSFVTFLVSAGVSLFLASKTTLVSWQLAAPVLSVIPAVLLAAALTAWLFESDRLPAVQGNEAEEITVFGGKIRVRPNPEAAFLRANRKTRTLEASPLLFRYLSNPRTAALARFILGALFLLPRASIHFTEFEIHGRSVGARLLDDLTASLLGQFLPLTAAAIAALITGAPSAGIVVGLLFAFGMPVADSRMAGRSPFLGLAATGLLSMFFGLGFLNLIFPAFSPVTGALGPVHVALVMGSAAVLGVLVQGLWIQVFRALTGGWESRTSRRAAFTVSLGLWTLFAFHALRPERAWHRDTFHINRTPIVLRFRPDLSEEKREMLEEAVHSSLKKHQRFVTPDSGTMTISMVKEQAHGRGRVWEIAGIPLGFHVMIDERVLDGRPAILTHELAHKIWRNDLPREFKEEWTREFITHTETPADGESYTTREDMAEEYFTIAYEQFESQFPIFKITVLDSLNPRMASMILELYAEDDDGNPVPWGSGYTGDVTVPLYFAELPPGYVPGAQYGSEPREGRTIVRHNFTVPMEGGVIDNGAVDRLQKEVFERRLEIPNLSNRRLLAPAAGRSELREPDSVETTVWNEQEGREVAEEWTTTVWSEQAGQEAPARLRDTTAERLPQLTEVRDMIGRDFKVLALETREGREWRNQGELLYYPEPQKGSGSLYVLSLETNDENLQEAGNSRRYHYVGLRLLQGVARLAEHTGGLHLKSQASDSASLNFYRNFESLGLTRTREESLIDWHVKQGEVEAFARKIEQLARQRMDKRRSELRSITAAPDFKTTVWSEKEKREVAALVRGKATGILEYFTGFLGLSLELELVTLEGDEWKPQGDMTYSAERFHERPSLHVMNLDVYARNQQIVGDGRVYRYVGTRLLQAAAELSASFSETEGALHLESSTSDTYAQAFYESLRPAGLKSEDDGAYRVWYLEPGETWRFLRESNRLLNERMARSEMRTLDSLEFEAITPETGGRIVRDIKRAADRDSGGEGIFVADIRDGGIILMPSPRETEEGEVFHRELVGDYPYTGLVIRAIYQKMKGKDVLFIGPIETGGFDPLRGRVNERGRFNEKVISLLQLLVAGGLDPATRIVGGVFLKDGMRHIEDLAGIIEAVEQGYVQSVDWTQFPEFKKIQLSGQEFGQYFPGIIPEEGVTYTLRPIHPEEGDVFLNAWAAGEENRDVPYFPYLFGTNLGLVRVEGDRETLEGYLGIGEEFRGVNLEDSFLTIRLHIPKAEIRIQSKELQGSEQAVAGLLFDYLIKYAKESGVVQEGIEFFPQAQPQQKLFREAGRQAGFRKNDDGRYVLEGSAVEAFYEMRGLKEKFNRLSRSELRAPAPLEASAELALEALALGHEAPAAVREALDFHVREDMPRVERMITDASRDPFYASLFLTALTPLAGREALVRDAVEFEAGHPQWTQRLSGLASEVIAQIERDAVHLLETKTEAALNYGLVIPSEDQDTDRQLLTFIRKVEGLQQKFPGRVRGQIRILASRAELRNPARQDFFRSIEQSQAARILEVGTEKTQVALMQYFSRKGRNALAFGLDEDAVPDAFHQRLVRSDVELKTLLPFALSLSHRFAPLKEITSSLLRQVPEMSEPGLYRFDGRGLAVTLLAREYSLRAEAARLIQTMA